MSRGGSQDKGPGAGEGGVCSVWGQQEGLFSPNGIIDEGEEAMRSGQQGRQWGQIGQVTGRPVGLKLDYASESPGEVSE